MRTSYIILHGSSTYVYTEFLQDIYTLNDSTGPFSIAQVQSHQFLQDHENLFSREHMYICVNCSTLPIYDLYRSLFILKKRSPLNQLIIFQSYLSLLVYQTLDSKLCSAVLDLGEVYLRKFKWTRNIFNPPPGLYTITQWSYLNKVYPETKIFFG